MPSLVLVPPPLAAAQFATGTVFFVNGLLFATWGVHVPDFKALHALSDAALSLALFGAGVGALGGVLRAGAWVDRFGARAVTATGVVASALALAVLLRLPSFGAGVAALFVFGLASSIADVAINAHAVAVEAAMARPILSRCHGFFSLGGLAGAALGSASAAAGVGAPLHMAGVAMVAGLAALAAVGALLPDRPGTGRPAGERSAGFALPSRAVLLLGGLAALGFLTEGAMYDWSVLYLRDSLGAPQALAAFAYGSFSVAMAAGRFGGDAVRARWGAVRLLRASGVLAAAGLVATVLVGQPVVALAGFALVGLAIANIVPVLFACAGAVSGLSPAQGISVVAGMGYVGFLGGPPLVGGIAELAGLPFALGTLALFVALLAVLARRALPKGVR